MGLSRSASGKNAGKRTNVGADTVALAGTPNVGKSTVFNALTGLHQHTGNWSGKTVEVASGRCRGTEMTLVDLPGCYSLQSNSPEEEVARDFLRYGGAGLCVVVCDATAPARSIGLLLEILEFFPKCILCLNLMDEAKRKEIFVDAARLERLLGIPVVTTEQGYEQLRAVMQAPVYRTKPMQMDYSEHCDTAARTRGRTLAARWLAEECFIRKKTPPRVSRIDRIVTDRRFALPVMLFMLALVFWLTMEGANYPSALLQKGLFWVEDRMYALSLAAGLPTWFCSLVWQGVYRVTAWVVGVMLPPMAIFFPLFTLMEDVGLLPRIAMNTDRAFQCCNSCGRQSLCMMMGLGCNAAGVVGCRIISSPRERMIAMLTNSFMPCNGRLPMLSTLLSLFAVGGTLWAAGWMVGLFLLAIAGTFAASYFLSVTVLRGSDSSFVLELPPYRRPRVGQILLRSMLDRTLFVLGRAVRVAAPAGLLIWLLSNLQIGGQSMMQYAAAWLQPFAAPFGMDGTILLAFLLGLPAAEIVLPLILMGYTGASVLGAQTMEIKSVLLSGGWDGKRALCVMIFCLFHWPCSTTLQTIAKETGSKKWALLAAALPTVVGLTLCFLIELFF